MKNLEKLVAHNYPVLGSSQNPEEVSLAVKAGAVAILPALTLVLSLFGVEAEWLKELVNALVGLVASGCFVWGIIRKFKKIE
jgi:hypothetical protein